MYGMFLPPVNYDLVREKVVRPEDQEPKAAIFRGGAVHKETTHQEGVARQALTNADTPYEIGVTQLNCPTADDRVHHHFVGYPLNRKKQPSQNRFPLNQRKVGLFPDPALLPGLTDLEERGSQDQPDGRTRRYSRPELIS